MGGNLLSGIRPLMHKYHGILLSGIRLHMHKLHGVSAKLAAKLAPWLHIIHLNQPQGWIGVIYISLSLSGII